MNTERCCGNCIHSDQTNSGAVFCRHDPPQVVAITSTRVVMVGEDGEPAKRGSKGTPVAISATSGYGSHFPRVEPDWKCSKHSGIILPGNDVKKLLGH